jgi:hypothetical protein
MYVEGQYNSIKYNRIYNNWAYGVQLYNGHTYPGGYNVVEWNLIYHNGYGSTTSSGMVVDANQPGNTIRYNVLCDNANYAILVRAGLPNNKFTGNVSCYNHGGGFLFYEPGTGDTFTGNLSYNDAGAAMAGTPPLVSDYNVYWKSGGTPVLQWNGTSYTSLSAFQSASGQDAHSKVADPQFKNVPSSGFDSTKMTSYNFCTPLTATLCNP